MDYDQLGIATTYDGGTRADAGATPALATFIIGAERREGRARTPREKGEDGV
jgi:hypothetical protein